MKRLLVILCFLAVNAYADTETEISSSLMGLGIADDPASYLAEQITGDAVLDKVITVYNNGAVTSYAPTADTNAARCTALQTAVSAGGTGALIEIEQDTYTCTSTITLLDGQTLRGKGMPTIISSGLGDNVPLITITNDDITLENLKVQSNSTCIGLHSATPTTISNLLIRNVEATVTDTNANALMFSETSAGGNTEHLITAKIFNSKFHGGTTLGYGSHAALQTGSEMNYYNCDIYGATDGYLHKNSDGVQAGVTNLYGGKARSVLDACTSGGTNNVLNIFGTDCQGDQADIYGDDGDVNIFWAASGAGLVVGNGINYPQEGFIFAGYGGSIGGGLCTAAAGGSFDACVGRGASGGVDFIDTTGAQVSVARIRNAGTYINVPTTQAVTAVGNTILATTAQMTLDPNGNYTMTSAPTIADGTAGQVVCYGAGNGEANVITFQDGGTLPSSNLQLGAATRAVGALDNLCLRFDGAEWVEISFTAN